MIRLLAPALLVLFLCAGCKPYNPFAWPRKVTKAAPPAAQMPRLTTSVMPEPEPEPELSPSEPVPPLAEQSPSLEQSSVGESPTIDQASAEQPSELFSDAFAELQGSIRWNRNGEKSAEGPRSLRTIFFFAAVPEGGKLTMQVVEDAKTPGPDGQPGVLSLSYQELPATLAWSGFVYQGGLKGGNRLTLPRLKAARSAADLAGMRLKFRYRAQNAASDSPVSMKMGCRLEPVLPESFERRLDLGSLVATDDWGTFDFLLTEGKNQEAFFKALSDGQPTEFKIVWAQEGASSNYKAGDTLLIDDVAITSE